MRKHAKYFYFLFFIVILSFIFWGVGTVDEPGAVSVAEVGGQRITAEEYWRTYERVRMQYREKYKEKFDEEMEKSLNLKEEVLNGLIDERVLLVAAKRMGLTVTDKELQEVIVNDQRFRRDGVFKKDVYFKTLELNRMTPEMFESLMRKQILSQKLQRMIVSAMGVTQADLRGLPDDEQIRSMMRQSVISMKGNMALRSFIDHARQNVDIKINRDVVS